MAGDFIPGQDSDFTAWFDNFSKVFGEVSETLGFLPAVATQVSNQFTAWNSAYSAHITAHNAAIGARANKEDVRDVSTELIRSVVRQIQSNPEVTNEMRGQLGITIPKSSKTPVSVPTQAPNLALDWSQRGQVTVHMGITPGNERLNKFPTGVTMALAQFKLETGGWQFAGLVSSSPFVHVVGNTQPETIQYRVCYVNPTGEQGPWSETDTAYVANAA